MRKTLTILLLAVSLTAWADKWYVATTGSDTHGKGTLADPWLTIKHAADTVTGVNFVGDTIVVGAGTFIVPAQISLGVEVSLMGTGNNSILVGNYYTASESYGIVSLYSYPSQGVNGNQSISHLQFDGQNGAAFAAIVVFGRSNVKIHDVYIHDFDQIGIYLRGGCVRSGGYEGNVGMAPTTYETGNEIYNCILTNNCNNIQLNSQSDPIVHDNIITETKSHSLGHYGHIVSGWGEWFKGLKFYNNVCRKALIDPDGNWNFHFEVGTTHGGNEVYNNVFYNGTALDIASWENLKGDYDYSWWIHDNVFKLDRQLASTEEPHASIAINFEATNEYAIVENNYIENYPYGIALDIAQSPRYINDMRIHHNVFRNMGYSNATYSFVFQLASYFEPASTNYMSNIYFDNNTVHTSGNTGTFYINSYDSISGVRIRNNIIYNTSGNYYGWLCFWNAAGDIVNVTASNNDIYGYSGGATPYYHSGKTVTNYVASGNITSNPLFKSTSDLHLQSASPAINAGIDVGLTSDYSGFPKYGANWDIGAYEYQSYPHRWYISTVGSDTDGDGSWDAPWASLKHATDTVTGANFIGDTIMVGAGTFIETQQSAIDVGVSLYTSSNAIIKAGAALNPIIYMASAAENTNGNQSVSGFTFDGDLTGVIGIHVRARSNVTVHDCDFIDFTDNAVRFTGLVSGSGEPTNYAANNSVHDCTFTNCGGETYSAPNYFASAAIGFSGQSNAEAYDNHIDNTFGNYAYGINTNGIGYNRGLKIHDNTILISPKHVSTNQWQFSIELWTCRGGIEIYNNTLSGGVDLGGVSTSDVGGYGFAARINNNIIALPTIQAYDHTGVIIESDISGGVYVFNNIIKNYSYGLTMNALSGPTDTMEDIYVYNNLFIETTKNSNYSGRAIASGNDGDSFSDIYLYNNTCYTYSYKASAGFHFVTPGAVFNNINIRNNIFNNAYNAIRFENNTVAGLHIDNNCFYEQTNAVSFVSVTASDTTRSGNLYSTDPLFKSSTDLHLQSTSPCRDAGIDVSAITGGKDFHGASLYGAAYDIGAFEYQGTGRALLIIDNKIATTNYKIILIDH